MKFAARVILLSLVLYSCDNNATFEDVADINNSYWLADSIKSFEFNIDQPNSEYQILLNLRNGIEYPHSNIYIQYSIIDSTNTILDEELRNFQLFHPKTGYPFGNGSGNIKQHQFDLVVGYSFPYQGKYKIKFEQYMRYDSLPQIYSVGVTINLSSM